MIPRTTSKIRCRCGDIEGLRGLLARHPRVGLQPETANDALEFEDGTQVRSVAIGARGRPFGLVELIDNNPLVCADRVYVPDAASTLALIGLAPLIRASLVLERPRLTVSCPGTSRELDHALAECGYSGGCEARFVPGDPPSAIAAIEVAVSDTIGLNELNDLYDEAYERSFFVRRNSAVFPSHATDLQGADEIAVGRSYALYDLQPTSGGPAGSLSIAVAADLRGKCGAAQIVHVMNVMAGFEETLGLTD
jgi:hypothetical protein